MVKAAPGHSETRPWDLSVHAPWRRLLQALPSGAQGFSGLLCHQYCSLQTPPMAAYNDKGAADPPRDSRIPGNPSHRSGPCHLFFPPHGTSRKDTSNLFKQVARTWDIIIRCPLQKNRELKGNKSPAVMRCHLPQGWIHTPPKGMETAHLSLLTWPERGLGRGENCAIGHREAAAGSSLNSQG